METTSDKSKAMLVHLSTLGQWFFPFGNFIFPLIIWSLTAKDSKFIDRHGREAINFQLSIFVYTMVLALIAVPIFLFTIFRHVSLHQMIDGEFRLGQDWSPENITGIVILAILAAVLFFFLKVAEFFLVINASVRAVEGKEFKYPLSIPFLRINQPEPDVTKSPIQPETQDGVSSSII